MFLEEARRKLYHLSHSRTHRMSPSVPTNLSTRVFLNMRAKTIFLSGLLGVAVLAVDPRRHGKHSCLPALNYTAIYEPLGCYTDSEDSRTLDGTSLSLGANSAKSCASYCGEIGYSYAGTEYGKYGRTHIYTNARNTQLTLLTREDYSECFCGDSVNENAAIADQASCNSTCSADKSEHCGGEWL